MLDTLKSALTDEGIIFKMATNDSISKTAEIQLKHGGTVLVEAVDSDLDSLRWIKSTRGYAQHTITPERKTILMHRVIMERILGRKLITKECVDHINGNSLDNRRCNLRVATHSQNLANSRLNSRNQSGYKGVSYLKLSNRYMARIFINGVPIHLGCFKTAEEAAEAYKLAAITHWGEFAKV